MTENELAEFYMHLETKNADLRALVGELVHALEHSTQCLNNGNYPVTCEENRDLIARAKEVIK